MNREIKFRGKRLDNNKWVYGYYVELSGIHFIMKANTIIETTKNAKDVLADGIWFVVDGDTVSQYTGLKDTNNKKIYEGDIMNVKGEIGSVYYDDNNVCYEVVVDIDYNPCIGRYEVIGNIYDNKDLLN